jgi:hexulose-6-phosphate isomerase
MSVRIAIMQGRLTLPPPGAPIQFFPVDGWRAELSAAREAGLDAVEWIYELPGRSENPLAHDAGAVEVRRLAAEAGVAVASVCADYFMAERLIAPGGAVRPDAVEHLLGLLPRAAAAGAAHIVLPFVDDSSLGGDAEVDAVAALLAQVAPAADAAGVELHLETDLPPARFAGLLAAAPRCVRATYDIGNSSALGYDPDEELDAIGRWIGSVHVKDRVRGGGSVGLGAGDADLPLVFRRLVGLGFDGLFVLQLARGEPGGEVELARRNREAVEGLLAGVRD